MSKEDAFNYFVAEREQRGDWLDFITAKKKYLKRARVCESCGFPRSTLYQNKVIKRLLAALETNLQRRGILSSDIKSLTTPVPVDPLANLEELIEVIEKRLDALSTEIEHLNYKLTDYATFRNGYPMGST
jgi:hypothetical protein